MDRHRILILISAVLLLIFGIYQIARAFLYHKPIVDKETSTFVHTYDSSDDVERDPEMFEKAVTAHMRYGALTVSYYTTVGVFCMIIGGLLLAILGDCRPH